MTQPDPATEAVKLLAVDDATVDWINRYGGPCRGCADADGVCPYSGLPCGNSKPAIRHVLNAINYGVEHGYVSSETLAKVEAERDAALREMSRYACEAGEAKGKLETSELAGIVDGWIERCKAAEAQRDALQLQLDEAREVIEPFAKMGRLLEGPFAPVLFNDDDPIGMSGAWSENGEPRTITFGHLRRARDFLARTTKAPEHRADSGAD